MPDSALLPRSLESYFHLGVAIISQFVWLAFFFFLLSFLLNTRSHGIPGYSGT